MPSQFTTTNAPLASIITYAFRLRDDQVIALPAWTRTERFDIVAKYPDGPPNPQQVPLMVQALLADRFELKTHPETREAAMYALVLARRDGRLGPRLVPMTIDCAAYLAQKQAVGETVTARAVGDAPRCAPMIVSNRFVKASVKPISSLTFAIARQVGRTVIDRTGLTGNFDFNMEWSLERSETGAATEATARVPQPDDGVSLFTALEEQLGLRLESTKGPVEVLVIDHVERPVPD
jgi:uncharacterized protein (TIGR03435 family)